MKKTKLLLLFNFLLLLLITSSCQVEELSRTPTEITSVQGKQINPAFLTHQLSNKKIKPIWQSAITFENADAVEVNFTLNKKYYKPLSENGKIVGRQRLLLTLDKQGLVKETIIEYRPSNNFAGDIKDINSSNFKEKGFEGEISLKNPANDFAIVWVVDKNTIIEKLTETKKKKSTNKSSGYESCQWNTVTYWLCVGSGIEESCFFTTEDLYQCEWVEYEPTNPEIPPTIDPYDCSLGNWPWCDGIDDPGSDSGNTGDEPPPSCESFNFTQVGSLWQVAMVKNINFRVLGVDPNGIRILHVLSYPQAVYFGTPTNVEIGNTDITPGIAANVSARVLQKSMQEVIDKYGGTDVSDLILDLYFKERLVHNYPLSVPGGRVKFNPTENIPATNYKTNTWTAGNCN